MYLEVETPPTSWLSWLVVGLKGRASLGARPRSDIDIDLGRKCLPQESLEDNLCFCFVLVMCCFFKTGFLPGTDFVTQASLELTELHPLECWDPRCVPPLPCYKPIFIPHANTGPLHTSRISLGRWLGTEVPTWGVSTQWRAAVVLRSLQCSQ